MGSIAKIFKLNADSVWVEERVGLVDCCLVRSLGYPVLAVSSVADACKLEMLAPIAVYEPYQRQDRAAIVWTEPTTYEELALSFDAVKERDDIHVKIARFQQVAQWIAKQQQDSTAVQAMTADQLCQSILAQLGVEAVNPPWMSPDLTPDSIHSRTSVFSTNNSNNDDSDNNNNNQQPDVPLSVHELDVLRHSLLTALGQGRDAAAQLLNDVIQTGIINRLLCSFESAVRAPPPDAALDDDGQPSASREILSACHTISMYILSIPCSSLYDIVLNEPYLSRIFPLLAYPVSHSSNLLSSQSSIESSQSSNQSSIESNQTSIESSQSSNQTSIESSQSSNQSSIESNQTSIESSQSSNQSSQSSNQLSIESSQSSTDSLSLIECSSRCETALDMNEIQQLETMLPLPCLAPKLARARLLKRIRDLFPAPSLDDNPSNTVHSALGFQSREIAELLLHNPDWLTKLGPLFLHEQLSASFFVFLRQLIGTYCLLNSQEQAGFFKAFLTSGVVELVERYVLAPERVVRAVCLEILDVFSRSPVSDLLRSRVHARTKSGASQLFARLLHALHHDPDDALKSTVFEVLKLLLAVHGDQPTPAASGSAALSIRGYQSLAVDFLGHFCDVYLPPLLDPIVDALGHATDDDNNNNDDATPPTLTVAQQTSWDLSVELVRFLFSCTALHARLVAFLLERKRLRRLLDVLRLRPRPGYLSLSVLRLFACVLRLGADQAVDQAIAQRMFDPVVAALLDNGNRYNMLNSSILSIFDFLSSACDNRLPDSRDPYQPLIAHLVDNYCFDAVDYVPLFRALVDRSCPTDVDSASTPELHDDNDLDTSQHVVDDDEQDPPDSFDRCSVKRVLPEDATNDCRNGIKVARLL